MHRLSVVAAICLVAAACGDDDGGGLECGLGTMELGGVCVPMASADCGPGTARDLATLTCVSSTRPIDRRGCVGRFGPVVPGVADAVFVDAEADAAVADGTADRPFVAIQAAINATGVGGTIAIARGTYPGDLAIDRAMTIEGRCARDVVIQGHVQVTAPGNVAIRGVAVTAGSPSGVTFMGTADAELRWVLVDQNEGAGVVVDGAHGARIADSEITATDQVAGSLDIAEQGSGIIFRGTNGITVETSVIAMNRTVGVDVQDSEGVIAMNSPTARTTGVIAMNFVDDNGGAGIAIHERGWMDIPAVGTPDLLISGGEITGNGGDGILAFSAMVTVIGVTISENGGSPMKSGRMMAAGVPPLPGYGVNAYQSRVVLVSNTVMNGSGVGLAAESSEATIVDNHVEGNALGGISAQLTAGAVVRANSVVDNVHFGIVATYAPGAIIDENIVSGTTLLDLEQATSSGHGIFVFSSPGVILRRNGVTGTAGIGIGVACETSPFDGTFLVEENTVTAATFAGVLVQDCTQGGQLRLNIVDMVAGVGVRIQDSRPTQLQVAENSVTGTTATMTGLDGDGMLIIDSHLLVQSGSSLGNARTGLLATGPLASGFIGDNLFGTNGDVGLVYQGTTGMSGSGNDVPDINVPAGTYAFDSRKVILVITWIGT